MPGSKRSPSASRLYKEDEPLRFSKVAEVSAMGHDISTLSRKTPFAWEPRQTKIFERFILHNFELYTLLEELAPDEPFSLALAAELGNIQGVEQRTNIPRRDRRSRKSPRRIDLGHLDV